MLARCSSDHARLETGKQYASDKDNQVLRELSRFAERRVKNKGVRDGARDQRTNGEVNSEFVDESR